MKLLIVEDDQNKLQQLVEFISDYISNPSITTRYSYQSGLKEILENKYDLIILDMSMPTFDITPNETGGRPRVYAGKEILRQMERKKVVMPVIIVTQFETFGDLSNRVSLCELCKELQELHPSNYVGTVYYNAAHDNWKNDLKKLLERLVACSERRY